MLRWINQHDTSVGQRKILSPRQESNPWPPEHRAGAPPTGPRELMESKVIKLSSYMTGVLHTARINAIEVIVSSDKLIKMVNFKLGNEMWRWINQHDPSVSCWLIHRHISLPSLKFTIFINYPLAICPTKGSLLYCLFTDCQITAAGLLWITVN